MNCTAACGKRQAVADPCRCRLIRSNLFSPDVEPVAVAVMVAPPALWNSLQALREFRPAFVGQIGSKVTQSFRAYSMMKWNADTLLRTAVAPRRLKPWQKYSDNSAAMTGFVYFNDRLPVKPGDHEDFWTREAMGCPFVGQACTRLARLIIASTFAVLRGLADP